VAASGEATRRWGASFRWRPFAICYRPQHCVMEELSTTGPNALVRVGIGRRRSNAGGLFLLCVRVGAKMRPAACGRRLASNFVHQSLCFERPCLEGDEGRRGINAV
jgi:hypothetical protein